MAPVAEGDKATTPASADKQSGQSAKVEKSIEDEFEMFEMDEDLEGDKAKAAARATAGAQNRSASDAEEDYGDDVITDEDIGRLMIVTSRGGRGVHSRGGGGGSGSGKGLPPRDESANAAINEGLRFYQRELRGGAARRRELEARRGFGAFGPKRRADGLLARGAALLPLLVQGERHGLVQRRRRHRLAAGHDPHR